MVYNVLEYLDRSADNYPDKVAFDDDKKTITFAQLKNQAMAIGSKIINLGLMRKPVVVYLPKGCDCIPAFMGIAYSGGFYCPIDVNMPIERIRMIFETLNPAAVITNENLAKKVEEFSDSIEVIIFNEAINGKSDESALADVRRMTVDTDPLYVLFTSGSTGVPKGVLLSHRAVIDYIEWVTCTFNITSNTILGNSVPFYFDFSIQDIYAVMKTGAKTVIIPRKKTVFPVDLIKYMNLKRINTIFWVPSLLCIVANLKTLDAVKPQYLKKILFSGEVMPNKQLNIWRKAIPDALYVNLYGPTEACNICTYYIINRDFEDDEPLPIGVACENTKILVLNELDELVHGDETGELCVGGTCVALGYYNNPQKTADVFVQNPLNQCYEEKIYRTGDIVRYNEYGELMYISRKDFQIKHLGHRIELGEIETAVGVIPEIDNCVCIYDDDEHEIVMCYSGTMLEESVILQHLRKKIPTYMLPGKFIHFDKMPYNLNGKIDRLQLKMEIKRQVFSNEAK